MEVVFIDKDLLRRETTEKAAALDDPERGSEKGVSRQNPAAGDSVKVSGQEERLSAVEEKLDLILKALETSGKESSGQSGRPQP